MAEGYEVTGTEERQELGPSGRPEQYYIVYLTTTLGVSGSVKVKAADWDAEKLKPIFTKRAAELDLAFTL